MSKDMFLNVLIVLFPVLLYQIFYNHSVQKPVYRSWWVTGLIGGLSSIFCLNYPFIDGYQIFWDFRGLPLILAVLYGGYRAGAFALVMELVFRAYIGGDAAVFSIVFTFVFMSIPFLFRKRFTQATSRRRLVVGVSFALIAYGLQLFLAAVHLLLYTNLSIQMEALEKIAFLLLIGLLQMLTMALCLWLIENIIRTNKLRVEMQRSEKLGIISELAASLAHEIRNPLSVVRGHLQMASYTTDARNKRYMNTAIAELDRAVFIISDYLTFAQPQAETVTVFDASRELADVVGLMSSFAILNGGRIDSQIQPDLWVRADPAQLKQAVLNLLKNSIEASRAEGGLVELHAYHDLQQIVVIVKDSGVGMTPEEVEQLGQPFYSTKENSTGLGTMVTFRIVESMDGELTFYSKKGIGTQAMMRLPAVEQEK